MCCAIIYTPLIFRNAQHSIKTERRFHFGSQTRARQTDTCAGICVMRQNPHAHHALNRAVAAAAAAVHAAIHGQTTSTFRTRLTQRVSACAIEPCVCVRIFAQVVDMRVRASHCHGHLRVRVLVERLWTELT